MLFFGCIEVEIINFKTDNGINNLQEIIDKFHRQLTAPQHLGGHGLGLPPEKILNSVHFPESWIRNLKSSKNVSRDQLNIDALTKLTPELQAKILAIVEDDSTEFDQQRLGKDSDDTKSSESLW